MNRWIGSGRLTDNPVLKYDGDKAVFATFTVMCVREGKIRDGAQAVDFIDCKCTGHNVEFARKHLVKDKKVEIVGRLESGHYTDKGGRKIYTKTVLVHDISFGETKGEEEARKQSRESQCFPPPMPEDAVFPGIPDDIDGLPFA